MSRLITCGALVALLLAANSVRAQDEIKLPRVALDKLPKSVLEAVKSRFPAAELSRAYLYDEGLGVYYEVMIKVKGQKIDVLLHWHAIVIKDNTGQNTVQRQATIRRLKKEIAAKDLPQDVRKAIGDKFPKATYESVKEVIGTENKEEKLSYYQVWLLVAANTTREVQVAADGKIIREVEFYPTKKAKAEK